MWCHIFEKRFQPGAADAYAGLKNGFADVQVQQIRNDKHTGGGVSEQTLSVQVPFVMPCSISVQFMMTEDSNN